MAGNHHSASMSTSFPVFPGSRRYYSVLMNTPELREQIWVWDVQHHLGGLNPALGDEEGLGWVFRGWLHPELDGNLGEPRVPPRGGYSRAGGAEECGGGLRFQGNREPTRPWGCPGPAPCLLPAASPRFPEKSGKPLSCNSAHLEQNSNSLPAAIPYSSEISLAARGIQDEDFSPKEPQPFQKSPKPSPAPSKPAVIKI